MRSLPAWDLSPITQIDNKNSHAPNYINTNTNTKTRRPAETYAAARMEISSLTQIDDKADKQRKHKTHEDPPAKMGNTWVLKTRQIEKK